MKRVFRVLVVMAGVAAVLGAGVMPAASGAVRARSWGKAIAVRGLPAGRASYGGLWVSLSCGATGSCAAVGSYGLHGHSQGFIATERNGRWGKAVKVPAVSARYPGRGAAVSGVSCASAGDCAAVGFYRDRDGHRQGFVVVERNGRWGRVVEVAGALNKGGDAGAESVSCTSAGGCTAGGYYTDKAGHGQGLVVVERDHRWGKPVLLPALAPFMLSCGAADDCAASDGGDVAVEKNGVWGKAIAIPGLAALNKGKDAAISSVSCGAAGSCAAVGYYTDNLDNSQGWVATEKNGVWGKAFEPPGLAALNGSGGGGNAETNAVSCVAAGDCAAVGTYGDPYGAGFEADENNGVWLQAYDVGEGGRIAEAHAVSCATPKYCAIGGFNSDDTGGINQARVDGTEVPGLKALNKGGDASTETVSCPPKGACAAGGYYNDRHGVYQLFVVSQTR